MRLFENIIASLQVSAALSLMESPKQNPGLRLDAAVLTGAMIEGGPSGPDEFYRENGKLFSELG